MRMVIEMDGGIIQGIFYNQDDDPEMNIIAVDADTEGLGEEDEENIIKINDMEYLVTTIQPSKNVKVVNKFFKEAWK